MMHLVLTFGFSISIKSNENINNNKVVIKGKVKKKNVHQHKGKEIQNTTETQSPSNVISVGKLLAEIHVEYELLPNYNFKFDCRCWETAAKIYTEYNDWCLRPIPCPIKENTCWVIFSIHHLVHLNEIQLKKFFDYVITYHVFYGRQKFSERAKKDKVKGFYIDDKSINKGQEEFLEIYPLNLYDSNSGTKPLTSPLPQPTTIVNDVYGDFSITTYLDVIPDSVHEYLFRKMSRKERFPSDSLKFESLITSIENEEKSSSKQIQKSIEKNPSKNAKKGKRKHEIQAYQIHLSAAVLFSDMGTITSYNRTSQLPNVSSILIYAQSQNILSNKQLRMNWNPISIKLEQLSNFPADIIIKKGFEYLYTKIFFVNRTIITPYYAPNRVIYFEFVKCFLCEEFQLEELISFLTTESLIVEIIGVRTGSVVEPSAVPTKREVLLGVAEFDLSDLLRGFWEIRLTSSLIHPRNTFTNRIGHTDGERVKISWENSPLTADILTSNGTLVKIKVRLAYDLRMLQKRILRHENILNRIFFNLSDVKLANDVLKDMFSYNSSLSSTSQPSNEICDLKAGNISKHILTGFVIEICEKFYVFLEGLSNGYLLKVWEKVAKLSVQHKCIYYNSNYVFLTRLYEDFIPVGGIMHIKLSESLETQLRKCSLYVGKTRTTVQSNIMRKLGLMNLTLTMKSLCQARLFPEPRDVKHFINDIHKIYFENAVQITNEHSKKRNLNKKMND